MTETGTDDGFWRGLCLTERFDPPSCRSSLAAGGRAPKFPRYRTG
ncbi:MAG: hypothetical protein WA705_18215 [Candidatus Ozemobacteraceae bacterium]